MDSLFNLLSLDKTIICLMLIGLTFVIGLAYTLFISFKLRATKGFFITSVLMPMIVASVISMVSIFLDDQTSGAVRIATIAVALGLIRFRSVPGKAEELLLLFGGVAFGLIAGLGYIVIASIVATILAGLYVGLASINVFKNKRFEEERLLKVTIPEDLDYQEAFHDVLKSYLKSYELMEIKTSGMGSLYKLSYKIELYKKDKEKEFIDELRIRNSNLEIALMPYVESNNSL